MYKNEKMYLNHALANWSDIIFLYKFKVLHCPLKTNFLPDFLSRVSISSIIIVSVCVASSYHRCQLLNQDVSVFAPLSLLLAQRQFTHVAIDVIGPILFSGNGNCYTPVLVDVCTRFVFLETLPNKSAFCVASALFKIFCRFGFPQVI